MTREQLYAKADKALQEADKTLKEVREWSNKKVSVTPRNLSKSND